MKLEVENRKRTIRGKIVKPRAQLRYAITFIGWGTFLLTIFLSFVIFNIDQEIEKLEAAKILNLDVISAIRTSVMETLTAALVGAVGFCILVMMVGFFLSHRIYGPLIPIQRHIQELRVGNFKSRIHLRKSDDFQELQGDLNELAESMERRFPARADS